MSLLLLGYRGSGKTSIGRAVARELDLRFVDTDDLVIASAGKSIKEIFERFGEDEFRRIEAIMVREAASRQDHVIALGGGAILLDENRNLLKSLTLPRIYLKCDPAVLHARIAADPLTAVNRPSLSHLGGSVDEVVAMLKLREPLYLSVMTAELDTTSLSVEAAARKLNEWIVAGG